MLQVSRHAPGELLLKRVDQGQALVEQARLIGEISDYEVWKEAQKHWIQLTAETLGRSYDGSEELERFKSAASAPAGGGPWQIEYERNSKCLRAAIDVLVSLRERPEGEQQPPDGPELAHEPSVGSERAPAPFGAAEFVQPPAGASVSSPPATPSVAPKSGRIGQVFLVRGSNEMWMRAVAGLLERAGPYEVTVLNERPNDRVRLLEPFAEQAPGSRYAVVLLTADDVGGSRLDSDLAPCLSPRARQNVVFQMGVLVTALTPGRVCVLYEDGVELPCDLDGIAHVRLDPAGSWQSKLLRQLRSAGFDCAPNGVPERVAKPVRADDVVEVHGPHSNIGQSVERDYGPYKEVAGPKYLPGQIVKMMQGRGYPRFSLRWHTQLWQSLDAKDPGKGWGTEIAGRWYWYASWIDVVDRHCRRDAASYR